MMHENPQDQRSAFDRAAAVGLIDRRITGGSALGASECQKAAEIPNRLTHTDQALAALETAIDDLTGRLAPVMAGESPTGNGIAGEKICATELGKHIQGQEDRVCRAVNALRDILQRLEV